MLLLATLRYLMPWFRISKPYCTLYSLIVQPYCTALLYSPIVQPYWTALLNSLIVQPYCTALLNNLIDKLLYTLIVDPMLLTETCYYLENQVFGSVNNRDMSLIEMCFCSRLYGSLHEKQCDVFQSNASYSCMILTNSEPLKKKLHKQQNLCYCTCFK